MSSFFGQFLRELLAVLLEASPYILLGFSVAAVLQILLPVRTVQRLFGTGRVRSIFAASLLGIPLPLCSCSVLPTALSLRKRGAGRGATLSFLVSTPETGIDSIALTYGLMDPLMAIYRPFAALVSALTAGFAAEYLGDDEDDKKEAPTDDEREADAPAPSAHSHGLAEDALAKETSSSPETRLAMRERLRRGFRGAFVEIFDETSHWMLAGLIISALISVLLPAEIVTRYLSSGPIPLLLMLIIGIPLYICASASTPIAAALVLKGLSPGAALVFLLAGPATNIGSLAILSRFLGRRVMLIYITTIAVLSLALGAALDVVYGMLQMDAGARAGEVRTLPVWLAALSALVFGGLLFFSFRRTRPPREFGAMARAVEWILGFRMNQRRLAQLFGLAVVLWILSTCAVIVPPGARGLVRRFGAPAGEPRGEGLHLKWPPPIETAELLATDQVRRIEIGFRTPGTNVASPDADGDQTVTVRRLEEESLYVTGDENLLDIRSVIQYHILDPVKYRYGFADPDETIKLEAIAELLDVLAAADIDGVYTDQRREVESEVLAGLTRRVEELNLGIELVRFAIRDVHAPPEVHAAFRDVASAHEDKQTAINVAYRYLTETVNLARGEAAREVAVAKSYATSKVLGSEGESRSLTLRANAFRERTVGTLTRLYLETVEKVLANGRKIIRPDVEGGGNVDLWISTGGGAEPLTDVLRGSEIRNQTENNRNRTKE